MALFSDWYGFFGNKLDIFTSTVCVTMILESLWVTGRIGPYDVSDTGLKKTLTVFRKKKQIQNS